MQNYQNYKMKYFYLKNPNINFMLMLHEYLIYINIFKTHAFLLYYTIKIKLFFKLTSCNHKCKLNSIYIFLIKIKLI